MHEQRWKGKWRLEGLEIDRCIKGDENKFFENLNSILKSPNCKKEV